MDISDTVAPKSEQLDAIDLHMSGPRVFTITKASPGPADQPVQLHLAESDRPWRPGKSMRRVLISCWGKDASQYVGRRIKLWCDPAVQFGGQSVGGLRLLELSDIDKPQSIPLLVTRGRSAMYQVRPLADEPKPEPSLKSRVWDRSKLIEPDLSDDERKNWIKGELADLGGDTSENLTKLLSNWRSA